MQRNCPRFMISAPASGSGKTTVTCAVLQAMVNRGIRTASFKCGPDYIDPMFHQKGIGIPAYNLDTFFTDRNTVRYLLQKHSPACGLSVIEGVMGHYDGIAGVTVQASAYELSVWTETPVVMVVDCKKMSTSVVALLKGYLEYYEDSRVAGVILNRLSPMRYPALKQLIEQELPLQVFGYLPELPECAVESRHLGLVTAQEVPAIHDKLNRLAEQAEQSIELERLQQLAETAQPVSCQEIHISPCAPVRIAVAQDEAFCFYYQDNLELLQELGAELVPFSPLSDSAIPDFVDGVLFGGGYPELYAGKLAENRKMRLSTYRALQQKMPCIAECGGFLYLHDSLEDAQKHTHSMTSVLPYQGIQTSKLSRFGYVTLTAQADQMLCKKGESIRAHEFHYWESTGCGNAFLAEKPQRKTSWECVQASDTLYAGFPHLYFYSSRNAARNFMDACRQYQGKEKGV